MCNASTGERHRGSGDGRRRRRVRDIGDGNALGLHRLDDLLRLRDIDARIVGALADEQRPLDTRWTGRSARRHLGGQGGDHGRLLRRLCDARETLFKTIPAYWEAGKAQMYARMGDPTTP
jgi:transposase